MVPSIPFSSFTWVWSTSIPLALPDSSQSIVAWTMKQISTRVQEGQEKVCGHHSRLEAQHTYINSYISLQPWQVGNNTSTSQIRKLRLTALEIVNQTAMFSHSLVWVGWGCRVQQKPRLLTVRGHQPVSSGKARASWLCA